MRYDCKEYVKSAGYFSIVQIYNKLKLIRFHRGRFVNLLKFNKIPTGLRILGDFQISKY